MAKKKMQDEISNQIYRTSNLDQFANILGNRTVHVSKGLRDSIKRNGVVTPIKVNRKMEVIDGQHRLAVARELSIPIEYTFDNSGISVAELNNTSTSWRLNDYIHQYASLGNIDFVKLAGLLRTYPALRPKATITQAQGLTTGGTTALARAKDGAFSFRNYDAFEFFAKSYQEFITTTGLKTKQQLQVVYFMLYSLNAFDSERFTKKVFARGLNDSLYGVTSPSRILRALVEANNSGLSPKSKNWISLSTDELGAININNTFNKALIESLSPVQAK